MTYRMMSRALSWRLIEKKYVKATKLGLVPGFVVFMSLPWSIPDITEAFR